MNPPQNMENMEYAELPDLEEGEILECDPVSPSGPETPSFGIGVNENKTFCLGQGTYGYTNNTLKLSEKYGGNNLNTSLFDLESISSEGEYQPDEESKSSGGENKYFIYSSGDNKVKGAFYGTVEDIMSKIGETICRKSRCNYKKRKSKDLKQTLDKCSASSYDMWRREIFFCRLRSKGRKRKRSISDSNPDFPKERPEKRKRKKKKNIHSDEHELSGKKTKVRDFDEVRRNLLEKLKQQKAEESQKSTNDHSQEAENSEIQEVDMLIDCTNYVDDARVSVPECSPEEGDAVKENEGEDDLDLVKLRLIALASNKKRKREEEMHKTEDSENVDGKKFLNGDRKDADFDRNELLLRAEALKSALLKKHQKRLSKLKLKKSCEVVSPRGNDLVDLVSSPAADTVKDTNLKSGDAKDAAHAGSAGVLNNDDGRENKTGQDTDNSIPFVRTSCPEVNEKEGNDAVQQVSSVNGRRSHSRPRSKRKKSKSGSFGNSLKENEKGDAMEEDDRTLRSQLLNDLMRKKSLKNSEKKSLLMDSAQTLVKKPSPAVSLEPPKEHAKPLPAVKGNPLRKINASNAAKPVVPLKIPKPEIQRIIVHLGSDDSSDEDEASLVPGAQGGETSTSEKEKGSNGCDPKKPSNVKEDVEKMIRASYERSVELLLSQARKKIEGEKQTTKENLATPEAVYKHLPPSQRLEYIRLKQKIAERERLKMRIRERKKENATGPAVPAAASEASEAPEAPELTPDTSRKESAEFLPKTDVKLLKSSPENPTCLKSTELKPANPTSVEVKGVNGPFGANGIKGKEAHQRLAATKMKNSLVGFCGKGLKKSVAPPSNGLKAATPIQRSTLLLPSSQALISKLKLLLKKIKIEKMIEENYGKEIAKLRTQLSLFERKQSEQRFKIKKLGEESMKTYKAIQGITAKSNEKSTRKDGVGKEVKEDREAGAKETGKKPEEGKNVSDEPVAEISKDFLPKTEGISGKEPSGEDEVNGVAVQGNTATACLLEYNSPLQTFNKVADCSQRVDPNVMMCQFDLMGVCKDEECTYQHLRNS